MLGINDHNKDPMIKTYRRLNLLKLMKCINPLGPHGALKHHFKSLKTDLILLKLRVLNENFHETGLPIHGNLF